MPRGGSLISVPAGVMGGPTAAEIETSARKQYVVTVTSVEQFIVEAPSPDLAIKRKADNAAFDPISSARTYVCDLKQ